MKRLGFMLIPLSLLILLSGCSVFVKEVDYQPIADDLNEKNMDRILNAVDGYAEIYHSATVIKEDAEGREEEENATFSGVYNTNNNDAFGRGTETKNIVSNKVENQEEGESSSFSTFYSDDKYINLESNGELDLIFILDKLQGIEKIVPTDFSYGLDVPPSIIYDFTEEEFVSIINDDLQIEYDNFKRARLLINLQEDKSEKNLC